MPRSVERVACNGLDGWDGMGWDVMGCDEYAL
jgi:hypothetical protein